LNNGWQEDGEEEDGKKEEDHQEEEEDDRLHSRSLSRERRAGVGPRLHPGRTLFQGLNQIEVRERLRVAVAVKPSLTRGLKRYGR